MGLEVNLTNFSFKNYSEIGKTVFLKECKVLFYKKLYET